MFIECEFKVMNCRSCRFCFSLFVFNLVLTDSIQLVELLSGLRRCLQQLLGVRERVLCSGFSWIWVMQV